VPLLPLLSPSTAKGFASELYAPQLKEVDAIYGLSPNELETVIAWTFRKEFLRALVIPIIGAASAVLLLARRRTGRLLAIALCALCFSMWLVGLIRLAIKVQFSPLMFQILTLPGGVYSNVLGPLFFAFSILVLTRRPVGVWFEGRHLTSDWSRPR
jgi:hypothetical protein